MRIDRIWLAPYFNNQFLTTALPPSAPRDLAVYIYSDNEGEPGEVLFSKVIEDPRDFASVTSLELDFFELDLSNEEIGVLPDTIHIAYGNAGSDNNVLVLGAAPYTKENVSYRYTGSSWKALWSITIQDGRSFNETVIPIRARFRLDSTDGSLQFAEQVKDQSFLEGQAITPLILPEATGGESSISYSLVPGLPAGLSFDSSTRTIRGTPTEVTVTPVAYTYTATDAGGNTVSLQFTIEINSSSGGVVDIQYDEGEAFTTDDGTDLFASTPAESQMSTRFIPKVSSEDNREVRIDRIWLAPYFDNQFGNTNLPSSAPRDLTVYIYSDQGGRPGEVLFSKVIDDPRAFAGVTSLELDFFELDLSNEGIGVLPDTIHIAYGNAGSDDNLLSIGAARYATENVSHLYLNGRWREFWTITLSDGSTYNEAMIPIRARFRLGSMEGSLQFVQQIKDQSFLEGQAITPLILPEATGGESPISYSLMPGLPAGLSFDSSTRTIRGTPKEVIAAPVTYTYTATDAGGNTASLQFMIEIYSIPDGVEIVDIQYDEGEAFHTSNGGHLFLLLSSPPIMSTRFIPKASPDDDREVWVDRIWLAPYYDNQFWNTDLPSSAPRDLTVYIYSDDEGEPGEILFSKVVDDPRAFAKVTNFDLDFFELDLSKEGIGVLPDVIHIAYGDAGSDDNILSLGPAPYTKENVSHLSWNGSRWIELWDIDVTTVGVGFDDTVIPIRARFRLHGSSPVQVRQQATLPEAFVVHGNYPNPFQKSTYLQFDLPASARVTVEVIDMLGRRVLTVPPIELAAGWGKQIEVDGQSLPSGHYLYRIVMYSETGNSTQTGQFVHFR